MYVHRLSLFYNSRVCDVLTLPVSIRLTRWSADKFGLHLVAATGAAVTAQ
jgi:hypothetical protein